MQSADLALASQKTMRNRSNFALEKFEPALLGADFPVSEPDFNTRGENPDINPHIHDAFEIGYCLEGSGVYLANHKILPFKAGDAAVVNSREVHIAKGSRGGQTTWGWLYLDPVRLLANNMDSHGTCLQVDRYCGTGFNNVIDGRAFPDIADCIHQILVECRDKRNGYRPMVRALVWRLMLLLERHCRMGRDAVEDVQNYKAIARIMPALKHIGEHYDNPISIVSLARLCHASEANFRKLFHNALGCAAQTYLLKLRLNVAHAMLGNTNDSVLDIAQRAGYNNVSNFNRQFKRLFGLSPRAFRNESHVRKDPPAHAQPTRPSS